MNVLATFMGEGWKCLRLYEILGFGLKNVERVCFMIGEKKRKKKKCVRYICRLEIEISSNLIYFLIHIEKTCFLTCFGLGQYIYSSICPSISSLSRCDLFFLSIAR